LLEPPTAVVDETPEELPPRAVSPPTAVALLLDELLDAPPAVAEVPDPVPPRAAEDPPDSLDVELLLALVDPDRLPPVATDVPLEVLPPRCVALLFAVEPPRPTTPPVALGTEGTASFVQPGNQFTAKSNAKLVSVLMG
jgi:hypothetical protein